MSSSTQRFFKQGFIAQVDAFYKAVSAYQAAHNAESFFDKLTHKLEEKLDEEVNFKYVNTGLDFLKEVVDRYAKLMVYESDNLKGMTPLIFAQAAQNSLSALKRDINIYLKVDDISEEDKKVCNELLKSIVETDSSLTPWVEEARKFSAAASNK